jgi:ADP-ribose pyrophosphatase YjhB (NUDIX family)
MDASGGRLDENEKPVIGLKRELQEELGLSTIKIGLPFHTGIWSNPDEKDYPTRYSVTYLCTIDEINPKIDPTDEQAAIEWITADQIEDGRTYVTQYFVETLKKAFEVYRIRMSS